MVDRGVKRVRHWDRQNPGSQIFTHRKSILKCTVVGVNHRHNTKANDHVFPSQKEKKMNAGLSKTSP